MRIVSLLPAATEWIAAFGAEGDLVGRSHACRFPPTVRAVPPVTQGQADGRWTLDAEALRRLRPDLVIAGPDVEAEVRRVLAEIEDGAAPDVFVLAGTTFKQVLDAALRLGLRLGRMPAAMAALGAFEQRLTRLHERLGLDKRTDPAGLPRVACLAWGDPPVAYGHWTADLVELAGGQPVLSQKGAPPRAVAWNALAAADPEVICVAVDGLPADRAAAIDELARRIPACAAVRAGRLYAFDGERYLDAPGPQLYRAVELIAAAIYPGALPDLEAAPSEVVRVGP